MGGIGVQQAFVLCFTALMIRLHADQDGECRSAFLVYYLLSVLGIAPQLMHRVFLIDISFRYLIVFEAMKCDLEVVPLR